jgi:hypothetical protein
MESSFPIYILRLGSRTRIVVPEVRADLGHSTFWKQTVSNIVADHYRIPRKELKDLSYSQRRARICGNRVYFGEKQSSVTVTDFSQFGNILAKFTAKRPL